jgi:hypothetical protein
MRRRPCEEVGWSEGGWDGDLGEGVGFVELGVVRVGVEVYIERHVLRRRGRLAFRWVCLGKTLWCFTGCCRGGRRRVKDGGSPTLQRGYVMRLITTIALHLLKASECCSDRYAWWYDVWTIWKRS